MVKQERKEHKADRGIKVILALAYKVHQEQQALKVLQDIKEHKAVLVIKV